MTAIETLISVLCGPDGKCCISGSDDDRRLIDSALAELAQAAQADSVTAPAVSSRTYEMLLKAAGTALEVLQKHRQMKGDWPVGELGRRAAEELQAARDASFNADREGPAQLADSVQEDAADPLQGAANWLAEAHGQFSPVVLSGCLMIGYNRAKRLHDAALAARKQGEK